MSDITSASRQRLTPESLENAARVLVIFAAIVLLAWMEWRFALH